MNKNIFKYLLITIVCIKFTALSAQDGNHVLNQQEALMQYAGTWYAAENINDTILAKQAKVKMRCTPVNGAQSLQVEVFEWKVNAWQPSLVELISYDKKTQQIVALGQNVHGECFFGKGAFSDKSNWKMSDTTLSGMPWMTVNFHFLNATEVLLKGQGLDLANNWEMKYIKQESKSKYIGIQLVSVRDLMIENPEETLNQLGRMGFSFIETFVYNDGKFYGKTPQEFLQLVNNAGMDFLGSMVFQNLPQPQKLNQALAWWEKCINDHASIGVKYLTTSNHQFSEINTLADAQRFCEYYNAIGKLCKARGIQFALHNHVEEFKMVEEKILYNYFLEHTDPELVSFQTDLYWMHKAKVDPIAYYKNYPGRFISWHIKDYYVLGESGEIDFNSILLYGELAGIEYTVVEQEQFDKDVFQSVQEDFQYLYNNQNVKDIDK